MAKSEILAITIKVILNEVPKVWLAIFINWHTKSQGPKKKWTHFTRGRVHPCPAHTACIVFRVLLQKRASGQRLMSRYSRYTSLKFVSYQGAMVRNSIDRDESDIGPIFYRWHIAID